MSVAAAACAVQLHRHLPRIPRESRSCAPASARRALLTSVLSWPSPSGRRRAQRRGADSRRRRRSRSPNSRSRERSCTPIRASRKPTRCCFAVATARAARANGLPPGVSRRDAAARIGLRPRRALVGRCDRHRAVHAGDGGRRRHRSVRSVRRDRRRGASCWAVTSRAYRGVYDDPYATALAAYNAGPVAVEPLSRRAAVRGDARVRRAHLRSLGAHRVVRGRSGMTRRRRRRRAHMRICDDGVGAVRARACAARAAAGGAASPRARPTASRFKAPPGWQASPGIMGFMQFWRPPDNDNEVLMLFKSPKPIEDRTKSSTAPT